MLRIGSSSVSMFASGAPSAPAKRSESIGESSSPHTFTRRRFQPLVIVTVVASRSESSERYLSSLSTSAPFHHTRVAPAVPAQIEIGRAGTACFCERASRTNVSAYAHTFSLGRTSAPRSSHPKLATFGATRQCTGRSLPS